LSFDQYLRAITTTLYAIIVYFLQAYNMRTWDMIKSLGRFVYEPMQQLMQPAAEYWRISYLFFSVILILIIVRKLFQIHTQNNCCTYFVLTLKALERFRTFLNYFRDTNLIFYTVITTIN